MLFWQSRLELTFKGAPSSEGGKSYQPEEEAYAKALWQEGGRSMANKRKHLDIQLGTEHLRPPDLD